MYLRCSTDHDSSVVERSLRYRDDVSPRTARVNDALTLKQVVIAPLSKVRHLKMRVSDLSDMTLRGEVICRDRRWYVKSPALLRR